MRRSAFGSRGVVRGVVVALCAPPPHPARTLIERRTSAARLTSSVCAVEDGPKRQLHVALVELDSASCEAQRAVVVDDDLGVADGVALEGAVAVVRLATVDLDDDLLPAKQEVTAAARPCGPGARAAAARPCGRSRGTAPRPRFR